MMRLALSIAAVAAVLCLDVPSSQAQITGNAPWCAVINLGAGEVVHECYYRTADECAPNVVAGNRGFCNVNPNWTGPYPSTVAVPRKHPRRYLPPPQ